ncbi:TPA: tetratricopeptide repeat protein [Escherichia fergusonii]|uniref:tetratricopeptide repeat protein n=1 Tax=Escherichia fergusonii TaxID=564 RepID=UPI000F65EA2E|nr:tetratricopeptide repeat protein [Escherichia fergusonii]EHG5995784.1 tetratricopeptide repeat protein [Escherichia fergusonii]QCZ33115.1 tetratricopeptide repeat protein [Escherichia fergusonii]HAI1303482.1 tetratricopeptide repeat protein [Escherichia fergusonii]
MNSEKESMQERTKVNEKLELAASLGMSLGEIHGISKSTLDGIYAYAYDFYDKGRLDDAEVFFKFLCIYDFENADYIRGYAAVNQLKKEYQRAYDLYWISFNFDKSNDYTVVLFMGQCQLCLKNKEGARECFRLIMNDSNDEALKVKANAYLDLLDNVEIIPEGETV